MSNFVWREPTTSRFQQDIFYAKNLSLAWRNWEMNREEDRVQKSVRYNLQSIQEKGRKNCS